MAAVREKLRWHTIGVEKLYAIHAENKKSLTEAEALAMYNEYPGEFDQEEKRRVSHILVRVPPDASESAKNKVREKANRILNRLNAGESFAALARQFSDDELSRDRGGDRGFSGRGIIRGPGDDSFGDAAFAMKRIGEISDVVETSDGFHIILLTDLRPARRLAFAEVKDRIIEDFRHREIGQFWEEFGGELRARANLDWTSYELFRQAKARRRQEIHNAKIERMIAREQEKAMDAGQAASPQANDHPQPQQRTDIR
jgi:Parvulin-like peptidyl-prolyl isomerase